MAAILQLPVLFVVENNGLSTITPIELRQAQPDIAKKVLGFGIETMNVNGNNVLEVYHRSEAIITTIRTKCRPFVLVANTIRRCAHVGPIVYGLDEVGMNDDLFVKYQQEPIDYFNMYIARNKPVLRHDVEERMKNINDRVNDAFEIAKARFAERAEREDLPSAIPPDPTRV